MKIIRSVVTIFVFVLLLALVLIVSITLIEPIDRAIAVAAFVLASIALIWRGLSVSKRPALKLLFKEDRRQHRVVDYQVVVHNTGDPTDQFSLELRLPKTHFADFSRAFHTSQNVVCSRLQPSAEYWTLRQDHGTEEFILAFNPPVGFRIDKERVVAIIRATANGDQENFSVRYRIEAPKMRVVDCSLIVPVPSIGNQG